MLQEDTDDTAVGTPLMLLGTTVTHDTGLTDTPSPIFHVIPPTPHNSDLLEQPVTMVGLLPLVLPAEHRPELAIPTAPQGHGLLTKRPKRKRSLTEKAEGIVTNEGGWGDLGRMRARMKTKHAV
jgi:hypothetical protein